jgi:transcriptional regulator with XRE-family HTH domain
MSDAIEHRLHDLGAFIRDQRHSARLSMRKLSELAGISNPYLSQIERGLRKPSAEILQQIAHGLRISAETLYVRAGFLEQRDEGAPDLEHEIRRDPTLTDRQKDVLLEVYRSFRQPNVVQDAPQPLARDATPGTAGTTSPPPERQNPDR